MKVPIKDEFPYLSQDGAVYEIIEIINESMPEFPVIKALELAIEINNKVIRPNIEPVKPGESDPRD